MITRKLYDSTQNANCINQHQQLLHCNLGRDQPDCKKTSLRLCQASERKMYLIIVDTHSKWIETVCTSSANFAATVEELELPDTIVMDNGTCFVGTKFADCLKKNGIKQIKSVLYHLAMNDMVKCTVQIVKQGLKKITRAG